jgi:hypothetical protein
VEGGGRCSCCSSMPAAAATAAVAAVIRAAPAIACHHLRTARRHSCRAHPCLSAPTLVRSHPTTQGGWMQGCVTRVSSPFSCRFGIVACYMDDARRACGDLVMDVSISFCRPFVSAHLYPLRSSTPSFVWCLVPPHWCRCLRHFAACCCHGNAYRS